MTNNTGKRGSHDGKDSELRELLKTLSLDYNFKDLSDALLNILF